MTSMGVEQVRDRLRQVSYPGFSQDIVSQGFVREINLRAGVLTVQFAPNTRNEEKVQQMTEHMRDALANLDGIDKVQIERIAPFDDLPGADGGRLTPLQAELLEDGVRPETDLLATSLPRADVAPEAGYGPDGPVSDPSPEAVVGETPQDRYEGKVPVLQWEIDPADEASESGETSVSHAGWEYNIWWQAHPSDLVYVSMQALAEEQAEQADESARQHPMGRNVVVNLVYDRRRLGIVAIYGTARDFRPFVDAFVQGFELENESTDEPREETSK